MATEVSFPRQAARTQGFTLGVPRAFTISPDGSRVAFLRSKTGSDPVLCLWLREVATGKERLVVDPAEVLGGTAEQLPPQERARRERMRQAAGGVTAYATDEHVRVAAFALSGRLFVASLDGGETSELPVAGPVIDPRPDPGGSHVAYVADGALRVIAVDGTGDRALAEPDGPGVTYGLAEFVAAEEMYRTRGFWWSPDGRRLLVERADTTPVARWHIADPAHPDHSPTEVAYPAAGTANADVTVQMIDLDGGRLPVTWDTGVMPYLITVHWSKDGPALLRVCSRDQRTMLVLAVGQDGTVRQIAEDTDPAWVDVVRGTPAWTASGDLVRVAVRDGSYRLLVGEEPVTPPGLNVREVLDTGRDVLFTASAEEPTEVHVYTGGPSGVRRLTTEAGVHAAARGGGTIVTSSAALGWYGARVLVHSNGQAAGEIASVAETPVLAPDVTLLRLGGSRMRCAVLFPRGHEPGSRRLPVLCDPYGGPAAQRVLCARNNYLAQQWFADQGFAVLIADGRGTPGRGPEWDRSILYDEATPNVEDQVEALHEAAARYPDLDLSRVGIRGWSHGGYLAALAVLRRPEVFHAAVAGAPVTDQRLYDTFYTERYLGHPSERPEVYRHNSLIDDAAKLERPLMLIHGLADDNVVVAHTLRLSAALVAAGRPHTVLPLTGITHMARREDVAENLLLLQVDFLKRALGAPRPG